MGRLVESVQWQVNIISGRLRAGYKLLGSPTIGLRDALWLGALLRLAPNNT